MPTVILGRELCRRFGADEAPVQLPADVTTVRGVVRELDRRFPGLGDVLAGPVTVSIDGQLYEQSLLQTVEPDSEVCFLPPIGGG